MRKISSTLKLLGEKIKQVSSHRFLGVCFDDRLQWSKHFEEMIGSATPRINALKRIAAKSLWRHPSWILKLHDSVVNSIWNFGSLVYCTASQDLWDKITKVHARSIKAYCGVPSFVGYATLCDNMGIKTIREELMSFGRKRLTAIAAYTPFGPEIISKRRNNVTGLYKSPSEVLLTDQDVAAFQNAQGTFSN